MPLFYAGILGGVAWVGVVVCSTVGLLGKLKKNNKINFWIFLTILSLD
jgi:hypothetical protein